MFTWCVTSTSGLPAVDCSAIRARAARVCAASSPRLPKKELSAACGLTSPSASARAVSSARHHWLENTAAAVMPLARKRAPIAAAWARPAADRLRWVRQSSTRKPAGSPVPGASAWRISATWPPARSAAHSAASWVASARATAGARERSRVRASSSDRMGRHRRQGGRASNGPPRRVEVPARWAAAAAPAPRQQAAGCRAAPTPRAAPAVPALRAAGLHTDLWVPSQ